MWKYYVETWIVVFSKRVNFLRITSREEYCSDFLHLYIIAMFESELDYVLPCLAPARYSLVHCLMLTNNDKLQNLHYPALPPKLPA